MNDVNWRKPVITAALRITGSDIRGNLRTIRKLWNSNPETVKRYQRAKLTRLLKHAYSTVPYYNNVLEETGVVIDGTVRLEQFSEVPLLTKETIRQEGSRLLSDDPGPDTYTNSSGGTTGEPVEFVQDQHYWEWNVANKIFYQELAGKPLGGREMKLWASERDLRKGSESLRSRGVNFLYNRRLLNCLQMSDKDMYEHVRAINSFRPHTIWTYVESIHELARFVNRTSLSVHSPEGIVSTAGPLYEPVREEIETAFDTRVHNQYGSREVGDIACECPARDGLHVFPHTTWIEIVDEDGNPVPRGEKGRIVVTSLTNRSMPLVRYEIGDMGIASPDRCRCGRPFPTLEEVSGRVTDHFLSPGGDLVHPAYLELMMYETDGIDKFQICQTDLKHLQFTIKTSGGRPLPDETLEEFREATYTLFDQRMDVSFEFPDTIDSSDSGKFRYIISDVV